MGPNFTSRMFFKAKRISETNWNSWNDTKRILIFTYGILFVSSTGFLTHSLTDLFLFFLSLSLWKAIFIVGITHFFILFFDVLHTKNTVSAANTQNVPNKTNKKRLLSISVFLSELRIWSRWGVSKYNNPNVEMPQYFDAYTLCETIQHWVSAISFHIKCVSVKMHAFRNELP